jgi:plasmid stabilization system protein ParE
MMKYRIIMSPRADTELDGIHRYIAEDSPANADGMIEQLLTTIDSLQRFPHRTLVETKPRNLQYPFARCSYRPTSSISEYSTRIKSSGSCTSATARGGARDDSILINSNL